MRAKPNRIKEQQGELFGECLSRHTLAANQLRLWLGDALDFWCVEAVEPGRLIRLRAERRVPGRAWLEPQATA